MGRYTGKTCRLSMMLTMTFFFFLVEIVVGYLTKSMALVADSFHMLSDVLALSIAFACMKISRKKSNKNTFGWIRAEVLGALVNAVFLISLCFSIFVEALKRLWEPEEITEPIKILIVGAIGLFVNLIGIFMFHGHASVHGHSHARPVPLGLESDDTENDEHFDLVANEAHSISILVESRANKDKSAERSQEYFKVPQSGPGDGSESKVVRRVSAAGKKQSSASEHTKSKTASAAQLNMHGVFLHILGDAFGSVLVMINAIIMWQSDDYRVRTYLDPSLSLVMVCIIASTTIPLLKESSHILLQTVPTHINVTEIKKRLLKVEGVLAAHEFHIWRLAGNKIIASAHIRCRNIDDYMKVAERVKEFFHNEGIHSTTIQPEFIEETMSKEGTISGYSSDVDQCVLECPPEKCAPSTCCGPATEKAPNSTGNTVLTVGAIPGGPLPQSNVNVISVGTDGNTQGTAVENPAYLETAALETMKAPPNIRSGANLENADIERGLTSSSQSDESWQTSLTEQATNSLPLLKVLPGKNDRPEVGETSKSDNL